MSMNERNCQEYTKCLAQFVIQFSVQLYSPDDNDSHENWKCK